MKILFIDCCIRGEIQSRTYKLCSEFIAEYKKFNSDDEIVLLDLKKENLSYCNNEKINERDKLLSDKQFENSMFCHAHQFARADKIIIGAPYYDLSFPSLLKIYFENICVSDITFKSENDELSGMCKGTKLMYITTAGGYIKKYDLGAQYVDGLCNMLGIKQFNSLSAEALDLKTSDFCSIMTDAVKRVKEAASRW